MAYKKKNIILFFIISGLVISSIFIFFKIPLIFGEIFICNMPQGSVDIYGSHTVGQELVVRHPNLCKIGFFIFKDDKKKSDLILHIKNSIGDKQDLLKLTARGTDLYNRHYRFNPPNLAAKKGFNYFFEFEPLSYPLGKTLYFYLESPTSGEGNPIKVGYYGNIFLRGHAGGPSYSDGIKWDKHLAFYNYYLFNEKPSQVIKKIGKRILQDPAFIIFYFILCVILIASIFTINHKARLLENAG